MPPRNRRLRIEDMLEAVERIQRYTAGMTFEAFSEDHRTIDAVVRNFEVLGEAARHVDDDLAGQAPEVPWADVRGMRNVVMHEYFGVDLTTVWKTVSDDLAPLRTALLALLARLEPDA